MEHLPVRPPSNEGHLSTRPQTHTNHDPRSSESRLRNTKNRLQHLVHCIKTNQHTRIEAVPRGVSAYTTSEHRFIQPAENTSSIFCTSSHRCWLVQQRLTLGLSPDM